MTKREAQRWFGFGFGPNSWLPFHIFFPGYPYQTTMFVHHESPCCLSRNEIFWYAIWCYRLIFALFFINATWVFYINHVVMDVIQDAGREIVPAFCNKGFYEDFCRDLTLFFFMRGLAQESGEPRIAMSQRRQSSSGWLRGHSISTDAEGRWYCSADHLLIPNSVCHRDSCKLRQF